MSQSLTMNIPPFSASRRGGAPPIGLDEVSRSAAAFHIGATSPVPTQRVSGSSMAAASSSTKKPRLASTNNNNNSQSQQSNYSQTFENEYAMMGGGNYNSSADYLASQASQIATQPPLPDEPESLSSPPRLVPQLADVWGRLVPVEDFASTHHAPMKTLSGPSQFRIGRGSASQLHINEVTVSSRHCSIVFDEAAGCPCIIDHKSSNGTYINAEKLEPERKYYLSHGDCISLVAPAKVFAPKIVHSAQIASNISNSPSKINGNGAPRTLARRVTGFSMVFHCVPPPLHFAEDAYRKAPKDFSSKFAIVQELGKGNFATVYRAVSRSTGEQVAAKVIERSRFLNMSPQRWAQQVKEAELLQKLEHTGIASFRSLIHTEDSMYLVTELLEGGELFERLVSRGAYPEQKARLLMRRVLEAVAYLHDRGIVHRDLKPENIVLKRKGDDLDVKLVDFGVATELSGRGGRTFCGSMSYVAPEVLKRRTSVLKQGTYGKAVDMWSIGVIVHVVLTVRPPFDEEDDNQIHSALQSVLRFQGAEWSNISSAAKDFIRACFELREDKRITAKEALSHEWLRVDANGMFAV